ncbi:hypothetical protein H8356DRAFT_1340061 [Neocallimastix lanati (nom. inval.)]|nr:hypothetical protein H8356DRAFT_1340061 [Neocallimastix sp. JGI-2020a]
MLDFHNISTISYDMVKRKLGSILVRLYAMTIFQVFLTRGLQDCSNTVYLRYILLYCNVSDIYAFTRGASRNTHGLGYCDLTSKGSYELEKY